MSYTCAKCGLVSHNPTDEREKYCVQCHAFEDDDRAQKQRAFARRLYAAMKAPTNPQIARLAKAVWL